MKCQLMPHCHFHFCTFGSEGFMVINAFYYTGIFISFIYLFISGTTSTKLVCRAKTVLLFIWHVKKLSYCVIIIVFVCSQTLVWE